MPGMYALLTGLLATIVVVLSIVLVLNLRRSRHLRSRVHALPEQLREVASDASSPKRRQTADLKSGALLATRPHFGVLVGGRPLLQL